MLQEFDEMLECAEWMYDRACEILLEPEKVPEVLEEIARRDLRIKELEATIRRQLVEHLTIRPGRDVSGSLVMMSVVKDAERIGDFSRKIFKMRSRHEPALTQGEYSVLLTEIQGAVGGLLKKVRRAFQEGDAELAEEVVAEECQTSRRCDVVIEKLFDDDIPCGRAVTYTLLARYYNRTAAHLSNIASTVLVPPHMIDLPSEPPQEGSKSKEPGNGS